VGALSFAFIEKSSGIRADTQAKWFSALSFSPPSHLSSLSVSPPVTRLRADRFLMRVAQETN